MANKFVVILSRSFSIRVGGRHKEKKKGVHADGQRELQKQLKDLTTLTALFSNCVGSSLWCLWYEAVLNFVRGALIKDNIPLYFI